MVAIARRLVGSTHAVVAASTPECASVFSGMPPDGRAATQYAMFQHARVPLIFLTAQDGPLDVIRGIQAGARHYVTKPFEIPDLLDKVRRATGG